MPMADVRRVPEEWRGVQFTPMRIPIETFRLPNGLFVTLSEDHTAPIAAVNLWYHVGSANERAGRTGFAHLFEHMLFQGSADVGSNEHFELIQRAGGTLNGSTWLERTNYFETVPSNQLELVLWLDPRLARQWVERYFGAIPKGRSRPPLADMTMPHVFGAWKREVVPDNVMLPRLFLSFLSPVFGSEQFFAASVCAAILGLKKGSRLYKSLVRERQVAAEAQAFTYDLTKGSDLLVIDVTGLPAIPGEQLEQEVARE